MASSRPRALLRAATLTLIVCAAAITVPSVRSRLARSFVQVTHTAVHTERIHRDA
jgi:hypothetical protein